MAHSLSGVGVGVGGSRACAPAAAGLSHRTCGCASHQQQQQHAAGGGVGRPAAWCASPSAWHHGCGPAQHSASGASSSAAAAAPHRQRLVFCGAAGGGGGGHPPLPGAPWLPVSGPSPTTSGYPAAVGAAAPPPLASLTRVLLLGQPSNVLRAITKRKFPAKFGPLSLLLFLFGMVVAVMAAVRSALVKRVKACKCCKGFGVVRCRLCGGRGSVAWKAKLSYSESCPLCLSKRFVVCTVCGGHYHRALFSHVRPVGKGSTGPVPEGRAPRD